MSGRGATFGTVEKLPSKRYRARYMGPDGVRYSAPSTFRTVDEAGDYLSREAADISRGKWRPPTLRDVEVWQDPEAGPLFALFARRFHEGLEVEPRTAKEYRRLLERRLVPTFGGLHLNEITVEQVDDWFATLSKTRTERARAYERLAAIMKHAVRRGHIAQSPCLVVGGTSAPAAKPRDIATTHEVEQMTKAMPPEYAVAVTLGSWCALRIGEIRELRRKDINRATATVMVRRAVSLSDEVAHLVKEPKSDAGRRDVSVPAHVWPLLESHLDEFVGPDDNALLFHSVRDEDRHLAYSVFHGRWDNARKSVGRPDLRFHDLRHTGLTWTARTGATLKEIMARGGHSTVGASIRYQAASTKRDRAISDALSTMDLD